MSQATHPQIADNKVSLFVTILDKKELTFNGSTPRDAFIQAFKYMGCKTIEEFKSLLCKEAALVTHASDNWQPQDYIQDGEIIN